MGLECHDALVTVFVCVSVCLCVLCVCLCKVHIRSTDYDRTLMSAYCNLAGLFPPQQSERWSDKLPWQPIPVHTQPLGSDYVSCYDAVIVWLGFCCLVTLFGHSGRLFDPLFRARVNMKWIFGPALIVRQHHYAKHKMQPVITDVVSMLDSGAEGPKFKSQPRPVG